MSGAKKTGEVAGSRAPIDITTTVGDAENTQPKPLGTEVTRYNALKHGILSRHTVLPWENAEEYETLLSALISGHNPSGPTEEHLVEELAGIMWLKQRLRLAECASFQTGLERAVEPYNGAVGAALVHLHSGKQIEHAVDAIKATPDSTLALICDLDKDEAMTNQALAVLDADEPGCYENAITALRADTREWWEDQLSDAFNQAEDEEEVVTPDPAGLRRFIDT